MSAQEEVIDKELKPIYLSDIFLNNYSVFQESKQFNARISNEIEILAQNLELDMSNIDLRDVFDICPETNSFLNLKVNNMLDVGLITAKLINFYRNSKSNSESSSESDSKSDTQEISSFTVEELGRIQETISMAQSLRISDISAKIRTAENKINSYRSDIRYLRDDIRGFFGNMTMCEEFTSIIDELPNRVNDTRTHPKFDFIDIEFNSDSSIILSFMTKNDLILRDNYENIRLNLGKFKLFLIIDKIGVSLYVSIDGSQYKLSRNGYIHPHISSDGSICWGNMYEMYETAKNDFNLNLMLTTASSVLENYNEGDAYIKLSDLGIGCSQLQPNLNHIEEPDEYYQYVTCDECGSETEFLITDGYAEGECHECGEWLIYEE